MTDYPWYDLIDNSSEITQGDILFQCPVAKLAENNDYKAGNEFNAEAEIDIIDGIILTQACDIENSKVNNIILCAITSKVDFESQLSDSGKSRKDIQKDLEGIVKWQQNALHIINCYESEKFKQDFYIVNFKDVFSIPLILAQKIAKDNGKRLRLLPPYREHLSQAFARFFMRVGLPVNIKL